MDLGHPCFEGADLTVLPVLGGQRAAVGGPMSAHGTHVASVIFGRKKSPVEGLAPECRGVIVPVFSDHKAKVSQLDLTRGIELAVEAGAHLINISGGQLIEEAESEADEWLRRAVELCRERDVLIVAAAGNDRCACLHLPAALPSVLAVGAMDDDGYPLEFSNWGAGYGRQGVLAPGLTSWGPCRGRDDAADGQQLRHPGRHRCGRPAAQRTARGRRDAFPARDPRGAAGRGAAVQAPHRARPGPLPRGAVGRYPNLEVDNDEEPYVDSARARGHDRLLRVPGRHRPLRTL